MEKLFKNQLDKWTYDKIESNPQKFGGDDSNALIMHEYLQEFHFEKTVVQIEPYVFSILASVSRIKNKLLEKNPNLDYRVKFKSKKKRRLS